MTRFPGRAERAARVVGAAGLAAALAATLAGCRADPADRGLPFGPPEVAAVRQVIADYTAAWHDNDSAAVFRTLTTDAVLLPHQGAVPRRGRERIRELWWPAGSRAGVAVFEQSIDEIAGHGALAYARGRFRLVFVPDSAVPRARLLSEGNWVSLFRRTPEGWRMTHRLWDDPAPVALDTAAAACAADPAFAQLDFWLGEWVVLEGGTQVGTNRISKTLEGCAVVEDWADTAGGKGTSFFYYQPAAAQWRQLWVTTRATSRGGVKEKRLVARFPGGAVRFQGEIPLTDGSSYLDRTTLIPLAADTVRQLIEVSETGGASWRPVFDAVYYRR